jgi:hypothetical protein
VPDGIDVLLTFGPYGKILPIWQEAASRRPTPVVVHWNTEGMPDIKLPTSIIDLLAYSRAQIGLMSPIPRFASYAIACKESDRQLGRPQHASLALRR